MEKSLNSTKLELLLGRTLAMESKLESIEKTIQEKIDPNLKKEFLSDKDLETLYGLSKATRNKLVRNLQLKRYKCGGKASASLYLKEEVDQVILNGLVFPHNPKVQEA